MLVELRWNAFSRPVNLNQLLLESVLCDRAILDHDFHYREHQSRISLTWARR